MTEPVAIADTNALYRALVPSTTGHKEHRRLVGHVGHLVVSPFVLAELDYLICTKISSHAAGAALDFIAKNADLQRFTVPDVAPHLRTALSIAEAYEDARGGNGVGLTDATNVALAAAYRTDALFTSDQDYRIMRPLTRHDAFRLLPDDL